MSRRSILGSVAVLAVLLAGSRMDFTAHTDTHGRCAGTMKQRGGTAEFVSTTKASFLRGDDTFWRANAGKDADQVIRFLAGRWGRFPPTKQLDGLCTMASEIAKQKGSLAGLRNDGVQKLGGVEVVAISGTDDGDPTVAQFSDFGTVQDVEVPADAVDLGSSHGA